MNDHEYRRERVLDEAVAAGKFSADRVEHYRGRWNRDSEGTERLIASLAPGLTPIQTVALLPEAREDPMALAATLFPELRRPQPLRHGGSPPVLPEPQAVRRAEPIQAEHARPPDAPAAGVPDAKTVERWSQAMFPEAKPRDAKPPLVTYAHDGN